MTSFLDRVWQAAGGRLDRDGRSLLDHYGEAGGQGSDVPP
jgi:hypothetical protein